MFKSHGFAKPQVKSLVGALAVMALAMLGSLAFPVLGYVFALSSLVMIIVVMLTNSIWPTQSRKEKSTCIFIVLGINHRAYYPLSRHHLFERWSVCGL